MLHISLEGMSYLGSMELDCDGDRVLRPKVSIVANLNVSPTELQAIYAHFCVEQVEMRAGDYGNIFAETLVAEKGYTLADVSNTRLQPSDKGNDVNVVLVTGSAHGVRKTAVWYTTPPSKAQTIEELRKKVASLEQQVENLKDTNALLLGTTVEEPIKPIDFELDRDFGWIKIDSVDAMTSSTEGLIHLIRGIHKDGTMHKVRILQHSVYWDHTPRQGEYLVKTTMGQWKVLSLNALYDSLVNK